MKSDQIREEFLRFFKGQGHTIVPSSSLIPRGDPTLLFTSAGMVQFKPYFLGESVPPNRRLASCQKCFRTTDIDSVSDPKHLTFFEMLGNFSIGDYFKREAIGWAWEFVTGWLSVAQERLWVTIFLDDDESFRYWREIGVLAERIKRCGEEDNFWGPAGDSGPCGPCSEIHYDFGEEFGCGKPDCGPSCGCGRFLEIWNLVFTQFNQDKEGRRTSLPSPNIDTGMGLERIAAVMQGKLSVYETDLFFPLMERVSELCGQRYGGHQTVDRAIRVVVEHGRAITFLIADGVIPSNEGRGYVLRRVLRRASLFGRKLGVDHPFLSEVAQAVIAKMGHICPELVDNQEFLLSVIALEEERFRQTLEVGLNWLDRIMEEREEEAFRGGRRVWHERRIEGEEVFKLYDTYGFPKELTVEVAAERGFSVDLDGFEREMERQRERARAAHKFGLADKLPVEVYKQLGVSLTHFVGYDRVRQRSVVVGLIAGGNLVESVGKGEGVEVILLETPFYGEMGGQVGDRGKIRGERGQVVVTDTIRPLPEIIVHKGRVAEGQLSVNEPVEAEVEEEKRWDIARNHTATHLLQAALRKALGSQVQQAGSLVSAERLRFDFPYLSAVSREQLMEIQREVNEKIRYNLPVISQITSYAEATARGAIALFEEKYGETVRAVQVGNPPVSLELCGGTHVKSTGEIGLFYIVSESSIGAGVRRIEAVTGSGAENFIGERLSVLEAMARELQTSPSEIPGKISALLAELDRERKQILVLERELARKEAEPLLAQVDNIDGIAVVSAKVSARSQEALREVGDWLKGKLKSGIIVLGAIYNDKPNFVAMVTSDLVAKGFHAGEIVKRVAKVTGGGGGGRAELGQAGGKDKTKIDEALRVVKEPGWIRVEFKG